MSMTPDQFKKVGLGLNASPSPFYTPRPERRRADLRSLDWSSNRQDRDREVNVQVLLRCRPLNDEEQRSKVSSVISCHDQKREVTVLQNLANKQIDRVFTFDKVFGPKAQQRSIYDQAVAPIVNEVLDGFNCTVFAYGQTGTGKTYTMEGGMRNKVGELPAEAGVIPRAVRQISDTLEAQNADYSMKVTFLELYNEEITDLLAPEDYTRTIDDRQKKPISLMEDGKGCVIVRGLEEESVYSANEIYNLLERGAAKRRTADTLLNKRSSRSHSVFSITIYIKEATVGNEELIKCGKLNLVDLAGSENISRSGVRESRAREAGEINKSLLTLGRVINALVEHSVHIPYRDSKLTRLLRDSLGGKTKTCIIATVSPSAYCLEETLSTLDYAYRAKNIKNKPEANQKMSKAVLLKDLYLEIERMKQDVRAAREKNGVYISQERFAQDEAEKKVKDDKIEKLEVDLAQSVKEADEFRELYNTEQEEKLNVEYELKHCKINLENSKKALQELQEDHKVALSTIKERESIISRLLQSENSLIEHAKGLRNNLQNASEDISMLFNKIDTKNKLEAENHGLVLTFGSHLDQSLKDLHRIIFGSVSQQQQHLNRMEECLESFIASKSDVTQSLESKVKKMTERYTSGVGVLTELANTLQNKSCSDLEQIQSTMSSQIKTVENFLKKAVSEANEVLCDIQNTVNEQKHLMAISAQKQEEGLQRNLASAQVISEATANFFNDLQDCASRVMTTIGESQIEKHRQLETFEKIFKEEAAREEKAAMEKIASILATLTLKRTSMVSEASRNILDSSIQENKRMQQEMSNMQQVSAVAKDELSEYIEKVKSHFLEDTVSSAETRAAVDYCLQECSEMLSYSREQGEIAQLSVNRLNHNNFAGIESTVKASICANKTANKEFISESLSLTADLNAGVCDIMGAVKNSLMLDHETKKELDSVSNLCTDHLKSVQEKHGERVLDLRNKAEQSLLKDYLVNQHTTPEKRVIEIPTLASIEDMRAPASEDSKGHFIAENKSKWVYVESKNQEQLTPSNRTPFAYVN